MELKEKLLQIHRRCTDTKIKKTWLDSYGHVRVITSCICINPSLFRLMVTSSCLSDATQQLFMSNQSWDWIDWKSSHFSIEDFWIYQRPLSQNGIMNSKHQSRQITQNYILYLRCSLSNPLCGLLIVKGTGRMLYGCSCSPPQVHARAFLYQLCQ